MRFDFRLGTALPRLAWLARLRPGDPRVTVLHGAAVETREGAFVEGAWDAPFAEGAFDRSPVLAGSGGRVTPEGALFATPANMYERLQSIRAGGELLVSNSLAFLLAASGDRLDPEHPHYFLDLLDFYRVGISEKEKRLRLAGGRSAGLHDCCNLTIDPAGDVVRVEKPWGPPPESYDDYVSLLERTLRQMIDNARDPARQWRYRPLTMVSQGYDSTAVTALAARAGCREAVTFLRSDSRNGYADDSGEAIARCLGLEVTAYERKDHAAMPDFREEEFYIEPWGVDRTMAVMAPELAGSLLLSGRSGETVWTRGHPTRWGLPDLRHPLDIIPGCALGELRMRIGFLHFAPATIAAVHAPVIHRWNAAPEMRPWSVGGRYDKPIARRIAETAGIPRGLFGRVKMGGRERSEKLPPTLVQRLTRNRPLAQTLVQRLFGNRFHPLWKAGSFEVQTRIARMIERYRAAITVT